MDIVVRAECNDPRIGTWWRDGVVPATWEYGDEYGE